MRPIHSGRLERWLGAEQVALLSGSMRGWYGPPIAVGAQAGEVFVAGDGDFYGYLREGYEASLLDRTADVARRALRAYRLACRPRPVLRAGFTLLSDLMQMGRNQAQTIPFQKSETTASTGNTLTLWAVGEAPLAGDPPSLEVGAGGTFHYSGDKGALPYRDARDYGHNYFTGGWAQNSGGAVTILVYDRLWSGSLLLNTTADQVPDLSTLDRFYVAGQESHPQSARGNFVMPEVRTTLSAVGHTLNLTYTNSENTGFRTSSITGVASCVANRIDHGTPPLWYFPMQSGDAGVKSIDAVSVSVGTMTGAINIVLGHPIAWLVSPAASLAGVMDGIASGTQMVYIPPQSCLAMLHVARNASTNVATRGAITVVEDNRNDLL